MAVVFEREQALTKNDLNIFVRDIINNNLFNPYHISFSIVDAEGNSMYTDENMYPTRESIGYDWADLEIAAGLPYGTYIIKWK